MAHIDDLIDDTIKETKRRLVKIEKKLYIATLEHYTDNINVDGSIKAYKNNLDAVGSLKRVLDKSVSADLILLGKYIIGQIDEIINEGITQLSKIDIRAIEIGKGIKKSLLEHAGINVSSKSDLSGVYEKVKSQSIAILSKKQGISLKELRETLNRTIVKDSVIDRYWSSWTHDIYSQYERAGSNEVRKELGLKYAIYEGGIIDNTREFCEDKNGNVFTEEEIMGWTDEEWKGKNDNYNPIYDCGGINCRHRLRWISKELAEELRPELKDK